MGKVWSIQRTLLLALSACRRTVGRKLLSSSAWLRGLCQRSPSALAASSPISDSRRHTPVCGCVLCEQQGTGEQAMRAACGDYGRFLRLVGSLSPLSSSSPEQTNSTNKPRARWAAERGLSKPR